MQIKKTNQVLTLWQQTAVEIREEAVYDGPYDERNINFSNLANPFHGELSSYSVKANGLCFFSQILNATLDIAGQWVQRTAVLHKLCSFNASTQWKKKMPNKNLCSVKTDAV